jgi:antirestriction protein ArdC
MSNNDTAEKVTAAIITALENGIVPWRKPWTTTGGGLPANYASGKAYRGINVLNLWCIGAAKGYSSDLWLTYKQAEELGGQVRKGEKAAPVVFWKILDVACKVNPDNDPKKIPLMRTYSVFNLEQIDGIAIPAIEEREPVDVLDAERIILDSYIDRPSVTNVRGDRAYYAPSLDTVTLPERDQFNTPQGYFETLAHELSHSTGHFDRLGRFERNDTTRFGCESYAKEELIAEISAAILAATYGVQIETEQTAAYVGSWLRALKDDRSLLVSAAQAAQKAADMVSGVSHKAAELVAV